MANEPKTMKVNDVEYVRADSVSREPSEIKIVVLQRGWVVVGRVTQSENEVRITDASVIRVWGTSKGLGEIAHNGPTDKTKLDECPPLTVHPLSVVLFMDVNESLWS